MAKAGKRYPLLIYTRMLDRWWPAVFFLGLAVMALAWPLYTDPFLHSAQPWRWQAALACGGALVLVALIMLLMRRSAYVQPLSDHLRLVTPFLRMNISYRRIHRVVSASMAGLFPPKSISGWRREILEPLAHRTALVLELNAMPMPAATLRFFLSPF